MQTRLVARFVPIFLCCMLLGLTVNADDKLFITSVVPTYVEAPGSSTVFITGSGFNANRKQHPLSVSLSGPGGSIRQLAVIESHATAIRARLGGTPPGTWQLTVTVGNRSDTFNVTFGKSGAQGSIGSIGAIGPQGAVGPVGVIGAVGATGATGPQGIQGPRGVEGTTGPRGQAGPPGPAGAAGPAGPAGLPGPVGPPGSSH
jgi:Collagen triple helix repeat (20 copies)/IPT/TIG domain